MAQTTKNEQIVLVVGAQELRFKPTLAAYNGYINDMMPNDKVAPGVNYLRRIVVKDDLDALNELLKRPLAMKLVAKVNGLFEGDVEIEVKNS
jgi:hypothetical protein